MDYSKNGLRNKRRELGAKGGKVGRKIAFLALKLVLAGMAGVCICAAAGGIGLFKGILSGTPEIRISEVIATGQATIVYDNQGNEIDTFVGSDSNRIEVSWDQVPKMLGLCFVAGEDERFYQHNGIDYKSIVRAGYRYIRFGDTQGASTITQQLLKNTVFVDWMEEGDNKIRKIKRKVQEQYLALEITKKTEKDDILLRYMNAVNCGQNTLGVESASQRYFGKSAIDLNLSECAVIASITQNPSWYNPISHPENNKKRRENCLKKMLELGYCTQAEFDEAMADTEDVYNRIGYHNTEVLQGDDTTASYFTDAVYEQVLEDLMATGYDKAAATHLLTSGGLRIYTTMDPDIQQILNEEVANEENYKAPVRWYLNYALTIYDDKKEAHNFSKENMTKYFTDNWLPGTYPDWYITDDGKVKFALIFPEKEDAQECIDYYRKAMFEQLGLTESEDNYLESIALIAQPQLSVVIEDQATGYVVALVGGRGEKEGRRTFNRATDAMRSPGSTFKVLASFAPAIDTGVATLATVYKDEYFTYNDGQGRAVENWYHNYDRGICSIRDGVAQSLNVIAVKNITVMGPRVGYDYLMNMGFTTLTDGEWIGGDYYTDVNQTLALGGLTHGVSSLELNAGFATLANKGVHMTPKLYTKVTSYTGETILDNTSPVGNRVFSEETAWLMTDSMKDVVTHGTGTAVRFDGMTIAGKTGTSTKSRDMWFAGYTPYYTATVWAGYDNMIMMRSGNIDEQGISKRIWKAVMKRVHEELPNRDFDLPNDLDGDGNPDNLVRVAVCSKSGKLPIAGLCDACIKYEWFIKGTEPGALPTDENGNPRQRTAEENANYFMLHPDEYCTVHYAGRVCAYDGRIACENCPFAFEGVVELPLLEPECLWAGSDVLMKVDENDTSENAEKMVVQEAVRSRFCCHTPEFWADPLADAYIEIQRTEMAARAALFGTDSDDN